MINQCLCEAWGPISCPRIDLAAFSFGLQHASHAERIYLFQFLDVRFGKWCLVLFYEVDGSGDQFMFGEVRVDFGQVFTNHSGVVQFEPSGGRFNGARGDGADHVLKRNIDPARSMLAWDSMAKAEHTTAG